MKEPLAAVLYVIVSWPFTSKRFDHHVFMITRYGMEPWFLQKIKTFGIPSRVSTDFAHALASLKPYRDGGNALLCAIHDLDVMDKHKLLVPTGNFTKISSSMIQKLVPDFPSGLMNCGFGNNYRDVAWQVQPMTWTQRRKAKVPPSNIIEQELDVPVEIVIGNIDPTKPALQVLQELIALAKSTIQTLYSAAGIKVEEAL